MDLDGTTGFRDLLVRVATEPAFAAALRLDPDLLTRRFALSDEEAAIVLAALIETGPG